MTDETAAWWIKEGHKDAGVVQRAINAFRNEDGTLPNPIIFKNDKINETNYIMWKDLYESFGEEWGFTKIDDTFILKHDWNK